MQKAPGGGPVDRTPPTVSSVFPQADSLHIPITLRQIRIRFSERMKRSSLVDNIFISPPVAYKVEWKGWDKLFLYLNDSLRTDQTYVISIASGAADLHNNFMKQSYQFAFSTGNQIDQGSIAGKVYDLKRNQIVTIFAYDLSENKSFNPAQEEPLYVSKSGKDGSFELNYLKDGLFRVLAVGDQNHNLLLDEAYEQVGFPYRDVLLKGTANHFHNLNFRMTRLDSIAPRFTGLRPLLNTWLDLRFSEAVVADSLNFSLVDSASGQPHIILGKSADRQDHNVLNVFTQPLDSGRVYRFRLSGIRDSSGNVRDTVITDYFLGVNKRDTSRFKILAWTPKDSSRNVSPRRSIYLEVNHPLFGKSLQKAFLLQRKDGTLWPGRWQWKSLFQVRFVPDQIFTPDSSYEMTIPLNEVTDLWSAAMPDSLASHYFSIVSARTLGEISGTVVPSLQKDQRLVLTLHSLRSSRNNYRFILNGTSAFYFSCLPEGEYLLSAYLDLDKNERYSKGGLHPFVYSEPFLFSADTIKVRKRWEKSGLKFYFPQLKDSL